MKSSPDFTVRVDPPEPILDHEIRMRAYELYERRGKRDGFALEDWLEAERELQRTIASCGDFWSMRR